MTPFEAYKKYVAIKLHFTSDTYDYFRFNGEVRANIQSFEKRNDRYFFHRLANLYDDKQLTDYLVANFLRNSNNWVGDLLEEHSDLVYRKWLKIQQSLDYMFKNDIQELQNEIDCRFCVTHFNDYFKCIRGDHPYLLWHLLHKTINVETFIIMNKILNFFPQFDKDIKEQIVWKEIRKRCLKYEPFMGEIDVDKFRKVMKEVLVSNQNISCSKN